MFQVTTGARGRGGAVCPNAAIANRAAASPASRVAILWNCDIAINDPLMESYKGSSRSATSLRSAQTNMTERSDDSAQRVYSLDDATAQGDELAAPEEFLATLFDGVAPEDVARYDAGELAAFAAAAWAFLASRKPGDPKIRLIDETYRD